MRTTYEQALEDAEPQPSLVDLFRMYRQYYREGHLITNVCFGDRTTEDESWLSICSCGDNSGHDGTPNPDEDVILRYFDDARWWARGHRQMHGLEWQAWIPAQEPEMFQAKVWRGQGHLIAAFEDPSGMYRATCSCTIDALEDGHEPTEEDRIITARMDEVEDWADEHRTSMGLEPQDFVPELVEVMKSDQKSYAMKEMPDDEFAEAVRELEASDD